MADPAWNGGDYYDSELGLVPGLAQARMIGHITYLSREMMEKKFGRDKKEATRPKSGSSPASRSRATSNTRDRSSWTALTPIPISILPRRSTATIWWRNTQLEKAFERVRAKFLVVALSSDWLYPPEQSLEIANSLLRAGKEVSYCMLHAPYGHNAFLVDIEHLADLVGTFIFGRGVRRTTNRVPAPRSNGASDWQTDYRLVADMIRPGSRASESRMRRRNLLALLAQKKRTTNLGVDIDLQHVMSVIGKGLNVFQSDIDERLAMIPDQSYDYAVLSETLQVVRKPRFVLSEMLRIAKEGIVSFPNFASWVNRLKLGVFGQMPKSRSLPFEWYETPNIHLATLKDFLQLCEADNIRIVERICIPEGLTGRFLGALGFCNLGADRVLVKIARK